ncbi:hypothetical protein Tsubulata_051107, partial [Turnera subulata]
GIIYFVLTDIGKYAEKSPAHCHRNGLVNLFVSAHCHRNGLLKLFVFGDSYVDTGNWNLSLIAEPYGITFPGKPSGRFSDGRVLTDYIAPFLGIKSPVPYNRRKVAGKSKLQYGMNMAYGSSDVFDTWIKSLPNLTTQINLLKQVVNDEKLYTKDEFNNSIALVSVEGNDYGYYISQKLNGTFNSEELKAHSRRVVKKLVKNLISIHHMGVPKIGLLQRSLQKLNRKSKNKQVYVLLVLYGAFMSAVEKHRHDADNEEYKDPLKPCCEGVGVNYSCGSVDKNGEKMYKLCKHPELSFFWDPIHPSQNGWHSPSLYQLLK